MDYTHGREKKTWKVVRCGYGERCWVFYDILNKISNEEMLRRVGEERILMEYYRDGKELGLGIALRHGDLLVVMIEGRIEGKRPLGRKPINMLDQIKDGAPYSHFKRPAMDRML